MKTSSVRDKLNAIDFERIANDFRGLDPNDPGVWPLVPRAVAMLLTFAAVVAVAWWFDWKPLEERLDASRASELTLRNDWLAKKRQAVNLDAHRQQLAEIDRQFGSLLRQLPNKAEMDSLLADINQAGLGRGLLFDLFKPGGDVVRDFYAEMPIAVTVIGNYHDLGAFADDVARMPRIVSLQDVELGFDKEGRMTLNGKVVTYRYLDEEELAEKRKQSKSKENAKK